MSIQNDLKKEGIEVINKLDTLISNDICKSVSRRIIETFPDYDFSQEQIYNKLQEITMYRAQMPDGIAEANYYYKNSSIYFNNNIEYSDLEEFAIHECIHHIQKIQDENENLVRLGLSTYKNLTPSALALNEAAVQLTSCIIIGVEPDFEKYYGISLYTPSPSYYPLECSLINQIIFFTGKDVLFKSTLFSTDEFKNKIIEMTSENIYKKIVTCFDKILQYEKRIVTLNNKMLSLEDGSQKIDNINKKIDSLKKRISTNYIKIQNIIIKEFFEYEISNISTLEDIENCKQKITNFGEIIGIVDNYTFFDNFYKETMNRLDHKRNIIENGGTETALNVKHINIFKILFKKIFKFNTAKNKEDFPK